MRVLGIETSCDETAAAVVDDGRWVRASVVLSSAKVQERFGGVVPEVAAREHVAAILPAVAQALAEAEVDGETVDLIAVTRGPGLLGALLVGVAAAKCLGLAWGRPVLGVHHHEAHLYAHALEGPPELPALALLVSGGHTALWEWVDHGVLHPVGATRDDAAGEALDKGARLLGLGYPGGPAVERLAATVKSSRWTLPRPRVAGHPYDFSFSGLKTATQELVRLHPEAAAEIAYALEEAVVEALVGPTVAAAEALGHRRIYVAGGVTANQRLRERLTRAAARAGITVVFPEPRWCTDNAAMVAALGFYRAREASKGWEGLSPAPDWRLG